jgi:hypothetical protein
MTVNLSPASSATDRDEERATHIKRKYKAGVAVAVADHRGG